MEKDHPFNPTHFASIQQAVNTMPHISAPNFKGLVGASAINVLKGNSLNYAAGFIGASLKSWQSQQNDIYAAIGRAFPAIRFEQFVPAFTTMNSIYKSIATIDLRPFTASISNYMGSIKSLLSTLSYLSIHYYPSNILESHEEITSEAIRQIEYEDGIALFYVLRSRIVARLLRSESTQQRRSIISHSFQQILEDCMTACQTANDSVNSRNEDFHTIKAEKWNIHLLQEAIQVLQDGHLAAGECLVANILVLLKGKLNMPIKEYLKISNGWQKPDPTKLIEQQNTRCTIALLPVLSALQHYRPENSDEIPLEFSRHAIAHSVPRKQFSKTNAAQGLLCVTSLMAFHYRWDAMR